MDKILETKIEEELAKQEGEVFAIFDFDNTCIKNDIAEATLAYLCRNRLLKDFTLLGEEGEKDTDTYHERYLQHYYGLYRDKKIKEAYRLNSQMFSGFTKQEAETATQAAIMTEGDEIGEIDLYGVRIAHGLTIRPKTLSLMDFLKTRGVSIWMVSASPEVSVRVAMNHFGITTDHLIGVKGKVEKGFFTAEFEEPMSIIEGKVTCLRTFIDPIRSPLLVIDDSTTGLPILETAVIKVVVNRNNALATIAKEKGWFLI